MPTIPDPAPYPGRRTEAFELALGGPPGGGEMRTVVLMTGPLAPPANGLSRMTETIRASELDRDFELVHVETSDHRDISNVARFDLLNVWLALRHGAAFATALLRRRPELVYVPVARNRVGFLRDALFLLPTRLAGRPTLLHLHSRDFAAFYAAERWWMRALIRACLGPQTHVIVLGESRRRDFEGLVDGERVYAVPNGISELGVGPPAERRAPMILHLATLWSEKGVFDAIEAAGHVRARVPEARLVLAGGWYRDDERRRAEELIDARGLRSTVELVGAVSGPEKTALLREASAMAFPTRYAMESHPLVLLEALCAGTPVVSTKIGAIPEIITDGQEGFLIDEGDIEALGERLVSLLLDPGLRGRMGAAGRRRYEAEFTSERFAARLGTAWRQVLETPGEERRENIPAFGLAR